LEVEKHVSILPPHEVQVQHLNFQYQQLKA
jgi:hypothetical protein